MSANKYANLPDIDTAPDVYETEDTLPDSTIQTSEEHEDEYLRQNARSQYTSNTEDISTASLDTDQAFDKFKRADRRSKRVYYAYPPSPTSSPPPKSLPLSLRLHQLQASLAALEEDLADPSSVISQDGSSLGQDDADTRELIRALVDVKARLEKIKKGKEGTAKLINVLSGDGIKEVPEKSEERVKDEGPLETRTEISSIAGLDKRLGQIEGIVGSSNAALDEVVPLPPPLLPLLTRLNGQLTLLTQPRHIDSVSRRLKLLLSDLDRVAALQKQTQKDGQRHTGTAAAAAPPPQLTEQLLPLLTRLGPALPHISHVLARLRALSMLHTRAAEFHDTLESMEEEQKRSREALKELAEAVGTVEQSLESNKSIVKSNVEGLEHRIEQLMKKMEALES